MGVQTSIELGVLTRQDLVLHIQNTGQVNKRQREPKGQSRMENPETLATLDTPDRNNDKQGGKHTAQYRKLKR